jgi:hypothetical protein
LRVLRVGAILAAAAGMVMSAAIPAWSATIPSAPAASPATIPSTLPASPAVAPAVSIRATSNFRPVTGDVYVSYLNGSSGQAVITGTVTHARAGEIIRLYAQSFPFSKRGAREQQQPLATGGTVPYTFEIKPRIATRFTVKLFRRRGAAQPLAVSGTRAVYVVDGGHTGKPPACSRPVCQQHIKVTIALPASAVATEEAKPWFVYVGVRLGHPGGGNPKPPAFLQLDSSATSSAPAPKSRNSYTITLSFSFTIDNHRYNWRWTACTKDTESADGIGLPGHHGCGAAKVSAKVGYLG